jgi:uncharacterized UPF0160 family protein
VGAPELFNWYTLCMNENNDTIKIATHNGPFHCDDVFAVAVLKKLYPQAEIIRTRDQSVMDACDIVLDVGAAYDHDKKRYDHHQLGKAGQRDNGISYSALGLVWRHYGLEWCEGNADLWKKMDEGLVMPIDADDNGQDLYGLTGFDVHPIGLWDVVKWFRPSFGETFSFDEGFMGAMTMATQLLERYKAKCLGGLRSAEEVRRVYALQEDNRLIILDEHLPLGDFVSEVPDLLFEVYPDVNNQWRLSTIKKGDGTFASRKTLPAAWAGLQGQALAEVTGVSDAVFCHNERWIAGAQSKEGAVKMAYLALDA